GENLFAVRMLPGDKQRMRSLRVTRRQLGATAKEQEDGARARALAIIEELANSEPGNVLPIPASDHPVTLGELADEYEKHGLHGRSAAYQKEQPRKVRRIAEFLGADRQVRSLSKSDIERFSAHR